MLFDIFRSALCVWLIITSAYLSAKEEVRRFKENDRVVFIGDSITHGGDYHKNIYLFYATRFPYQDFRYYNAGISGDTAVGTLARFDSDVAIHKPTIAPIMLGMNDVSGAIYEASRSTPEQINKFKKLQMEARRRYLDAMEKLILKLRAIKADIIFMTPSIYDNTVLAERYNRIGLNDELSQYAQKLMLLAKKYDIDIVDYQTPMLSVNAKLQAVSKHSTVVSKDRVHPKAAGHLLMSYAFLTAQGVPSDVASIKIDAEKKRILQSTDCSIKGDFKISKHRVSFSCQAKTLPFPIDEKQKPALSWVPFMSELNRFPFQIKGLKRGSYRIYIDGINIGEFSREDLARGIDLADNKKTPMYQQALRVKEINNRRAKVANRIRDIVHVQHSMVSKLDKVNTADKEALSDGLYAYVEKNKGKPWYAYIKGQVNKYLNTRDNEREYRKEVEALFDTLHRVNKPKRHNWVIEKI